MKAIIAESIAVDPRFSFPMTEATWKGDLGEWRRPDVQTEFGGLRLAFEIQLSTTFIRVIAERREFYRREGGLLIWLFKRFDESNSRLTQEDVFYNNNRNVFLASEETLAASKEAGKLCLECRWTEPLDDGGSTVLQWRRKIVTVDELTIDTERQRSRSTQNGRGFISTTLTERLHAIPPTQNLPGRRHCGDASRRFGLAETNVT